MLTNDSYNVSLCLVRSEVVELFQINNVTLASERLYGMALGND